MSGSLSTQTSPYATKSILKNRPGTSQVTCSQITLQPFSYGLMNMPKTSEGNGRSSKKQSSPHQVHKQEGDYRDQFTFRNGTEVEQQQQPQYKLLGPQDPKFAKDSREKNLHSTNAMPPSNVFLKVTVVTRKPPKQKAKRKLNKLSIVGAFSPSQLIKE